MRIEILNHNTYGEGVGCVWNDEYNAYLEIPYAQIFPIGSVHEVKQFYPDTGEVDLEYEDEAVTFAPSEYRIIGEWE